MMTNLRVLNQNHITYFAELYHWRQTYPHTGPWGIYLCANVFNTQTKEPEMIKRISVIMGNHPNYFPGWDIGSDTRMFKEDASSHCIGPWMADSIDEGSVGGNAFFNLYDGTSLEIKNLRIDIPSDDFSIGPIPIITIPFFYKIADKESTSSTESLIENDKSTDWYKCSCIDDYNKVIVDYIKNPHLGDALKCEAQCCVITTCYYWNFETDNLGTTGRCIDKTLNTDLPIDNPMGDLLNNNDCNEL